MLVEKVMDLMASLISMQPAIGVRVLHQFNAGILNIFPVHVQL